MQFEGPLDHLSDEELEREVLAWMLNDRRPDMDLSAIDELFNLTSPRTLFMKDLPTGARLLDLGAGDGGLSVLRQWPLYDRSDLEMYALSLDKGERFDDYEGYELKNFEDDTDIFPGIQFDAIICCHFIEHLPAPERAIEFMGRRLRPGGQLYLEWPAPFSNRMPRRQTFLDLGIEISTTRFDEDGTHHSPWPMAEISKHLCDQGFAIDLAGRVCMGWKADQLKANAMDVRDPVRLTLALWSKVGWAQYVCAVRR